MALEDFVPVAFVGLTFLPLVAARLLDSDEPVEHALKLFLMAMSFLSSLISLHFLKTVLVRAFGAVPTSTENIILNAVDLAYKLNIIITLVIGAFLLLATIALVFLKLAKPKQGYVKTD